MSRSPTLQHQSTATKFVLRIGMYLLSHPIGEIIVAPGVIFNEYNSAIPDVVYISNAVRLLPLANTSKARLNLPSKSSRRVRKIVAATK